MKNAIKIFKDCFKSEERKLSKDEEEDLGTTEKVELKAFLECYQLLDAFEEKKPKKAPQAKKEVPKKKNKGGRFVDISPGKKDYPEWAQTG